MIQPSQEQRTPGEPADDSAPVSNLIAIAKVIFAQGQRLLGADYGFLWLTNPAGSELHGVAAYGWHAEGFPQEKIGIQEEFSVALSAFQGGQPMVVADVASSSQISERLRERYHFVKSSWIAPLVSETRPVGILALGYKTPRSATPEELQLLQLIGNEAAQMIACARAEESLRLSEERHRYMFEKDRTVKLLINLDSGAIVDANLAAAEFYGYARETLQQMKITDLNFLPPEHVAPELAKAVYEQRAYFRFQHRLASNEIRKVEVYSTPFALHGGNFLYSIVHDVTDRTRIEEALLHAWQTYEALVNSLESIVWECDARTLHFSFVSKQAERFLGYPVASWFNEPNFWRDHTYAEDRDWVVASFRERVEQKKEYAIEHRMVTADGRVLWLRNLVSVIVEDGQPTTLRGVSIDVTERKQAEEAIHTLNTALEQRVAERTAELQWTIAELQQLTRFAAHDLQEPVRIVTSYVQLLAARYQSKLDEEADKFIQYTGDGMNGLQRLLLDLLAYSEASTQRLEYTEVEGEALLAGAIADLRGSIVDRGAVITHDSLPIVWGDETQLRLVFRNLLSNGIKFHNNDPPWVYVAATQKNDAWVFSVQDNGMGVELQDSERIFLIFQRRHSKEPYPKPGVGLAICKKIIERHGGRIWVESALGKGSTFYFTLPVKSPSS